MVTAQKSHADASATLVELMGSKQTFIDAFVPVFGNQIQQGMAAQGVPQDKIDRIKASGLKLAESIVYDPDYITGLAKSYMDAFSESEINELITFYKSDIGQKVIAKLPQITAEGAALGKAMTGRYMPTFQQEMQAILE